MNKCKCCGLETRNPSFCCRSCSAKYNNVLFPKRKLVRPCSVCGSQRSSFKHSRCDKCQREYLDRKIKNRTIGQYRTALHLSGRHGSWVHAQVRQMSRQWNKDLKLLPCAKCGYDKHVELCHIKPLNSFPDTAILSEVNSPQNIIQLCPNCHWEFDNLPR